MCGKLMGRPERTSLKKHPSIQPAVELREVETAGGDETPCFSADLFIDGTKAAHVRNAGEGGCCVWFWHAGAAVRGAFYELAKKVTGTDFEPDDALVYALLKQQGHKVW